MREQWTVLLPETIDPAGPESISDFATFVSVDEYDSREDLYADIDRFDAIITRIVPLPGDVLRNASNLRVIAKHGMGIDHVDVEAATECGIIVARTPGANASAVAEHAMAMLLAVRKHLGEAHEDMRNGVWDREKYVEPELGGDILGLFGYGTVGRETADRARGIGMDVIAFDPYVDPEAVPDWLTLVGDSDALFEQADVISVHAPLTDETRQAIGADELATLGEAGVLVNTARGGIVDVDALADAVENGVIAGAGVDVYETEPPGKDYPLFDCENVFCTPHVATASTDTLEEMSLRSAGIVRDVFEGREPEAVVNPAALE